MENIFQRGEFSQYKVKSLREAMNDVVLAHHDFERKKITVFISHKHDDLEELRGIIGFLEEKYDVKTYIDSRDPSMPQITSGETAERIKGRIEKCEKFILLATNGAIESKWCNWELGYGDACKFSDDNIALFSVKEKGAYNSLYKGNEYMNIYPHIVYSDGDSRYTNGEKVSAGYYIRYKKGDIYEIKPLEKWLS